jgi:hypothetical protein
MLSWTAWQRISQLRKGLMNRLQAGINGATDLRKLGHAIRRQIPLTADEYSSLLDALRSPGTPIEARKNLLVLALLDHGSNDAVLEYCKTLLAKTSKAPSFSGYEAGSNVALQILLAKSPDKDCWVRQFERSNTAALRLVVAEHIAGTDPQRGLMMMIETIPLAGTDHAVSDGIDLWLTNESNANLLSAVESKLAELQRTQPNSVLTAAYQYARQTIANA